MKSKERIIEKWIERIELIPCRVKIVLGWGNGEHVLQLQKKQSDPILIYDPRCVGLKILGLHFYTDLRLLQKKLANQKVQILPFRPSWGDSADQFETAFEILNGRGSEGPLLSIKDLPQKDPQVLLLQELIR